MDLLRSLAIGLYLEKPTTWLHHLDPRVKLMWLMSFLLSPLLANPLWRLSLVGLLLLLFLLASIPFRVFRQQMGWLVIIAILVFLITLIAPDGLTIAHQPRLPSLDWGTPVKSYNYVLFDQDLLWGHKITITRQSVDLAIRVSSLIFTLIFSTNLYLLSTAPEEITAGIEELMKPLGYFKLPITEIVLTLTLSLRFIPLVMEEIQNLVRSMRTRGINWQKLGIRNSLKVWVLVLERLLENLLLRAEQIAVAMEVRGFTSPNEHKVQWHDLRLRWPDYLALAILMVFWWLRFMWGQ
ncbi:energy-coupling factor transporter transmembrane protein EcfT [Gloeocapsa sp. PCC 73106]|uniref:energy-coupling factor transporter transmembrane component T family protein n=1 Tax=Gloeocapsa sp. PCC 73106 TaxID=102232 RepID=UPI0002ABBB80|nr:CbiQ family ECF transporter T component [Gloeocapsa sp. PCC 73106]ELS00019.1 ABC-type cobalt transport system, permease component CbiQ [Gloeocapsa sp. PCC 73106]